MKEDTRTVSGIVNGVHSSLLPSIDENLTDDDFVKLSNGLDENQLTDIDGSKLGISVGGENQIIESNSSILEVTLPNSVNDAMSAEVLVVEEAQTSLQFEERNMNGDVSKLGDCVNKEENPTVGARLQMDRKEESCLPDENRILGRCSTEGSASVPVEADGEVLKTMVPNDLHDDIVIEVPAVEAQVSLLCEEQNMDAVVSELGDCVNEEENQMTGAHLQTDRKEESFPPVENRILGGCVMEGGASVPVEADGKVLESTVQNDLHDNIAIEVPAVEAQVSLLCAEQNMDADVSELGDCVNEEENQTTGAHLQTDQKEESFLPVENRILGGCVMEGGASVPVEADGKVLEATLQNDLHDDIAIEVPAVEAQVSLLCEEQNMDADVSELGDCVNEEENQTMGARLQTDRKEESRSPDENWILGGCVTEGGASVPVEADGKVLEATVPNDLHDDIAIEVPAVEAQVSLLCEEQNTDSDVFELGDCVNEEENQTMGACLQTDRKEESCSPDENRILGICVTEGGASMPVEADGKVLEATVPNDLHDDMAIEVPAVEAQVSLLCEEQNMDADVSELGDCVNEEENQTMGACLQMDRNEESCLPNENRILGGCVTEGGASVHAEADGKVLEATVPNDLHDDMAIEVPSVESQVSLLCEEQNTDADVSELGDCVNEEENQTMGACLQTDRKEYSCSPDENRILGICVTEGGASVPVEADGKVLEATVPNDLHDDMAIEVPAVEAQVSLLCEEQNTDADVSELGDCVNEEENQTMGARLQMDRNEESCLPDENRILGGCVTEGGASVHVEAVGKVLEATVPNDLHDDMAIEVPVVESQVSLLCEEQNTDADVSELSDCVNEEENQMMGARLQTDRNEESCLPDENRILGGCVMEGGAFVHVEADGKVLEATVRNNLHDDMAIGVPAAEDQVSLLCEERNTDADVSEFGYCVHEENQIIGAQIQTDQKEKSPPDETEGGSPVSVVVVGKEAEETCASEVGVSLLTENEITSCLGIDSDTSLGSSRSQIVGANVSEPVVSLHVENPVLDGPVVELGTSFCADEKEIMETHVVEVGFPLLNENEAVAGLVADMGIYRSADEKQIAGTGEKKIVGDGISEVGALCDENQIMDNSIVDLGVDEENIVGTPVPDLGVSLISEKHMTCSLVVDLGHYHSIDGEKTVGAHGFKVGPLLCENHMVGSLVVDLGASHGTVENGIAGNEFEGVGSDVKSSVLEEHEGNDVMKVCTDNSPSAQKTAEKRTVKCTAASHGTDTVQKEHSASCYLPEEKAEFSFYDLVWGKVRSHPWWPGQIFYPSDSSKQAMKHKKKDNFLVAYFGDQTFSWCEASQLKPFKMHFPQMVKQSNLKAFVNAVDCALDEVSRRVELGLACSCMGEEQYVNLKCQMIENTGIREEANNAGGADISPFEPDTLIEYIKELALFPSGGDELELVIAKAQLTAFYRSKGFSKLPVFHVYGGLLENGADFSPADGKPLKGTVKCGIPVSVNEGQVLDLDSGQGNLKSQDGLSHKWKYIWDDGFDHNRKKRSLAELMFGKKAINLVDGDRGSADGKVGGNLASPSSAKKYKAIDSFSDDLLQTREKRASSLSAAGTDSLPLKKSLKVGGRNCRIASEPSGPSQIHKHSGERLQKNAIKVEPSGHKAVHVSVCLRSPEETQHRWIGTDKEYSSPDEMLSQLSLMARDPMNGYSFMSTIVRFFTSFRNLLYWNLSGSEKHKKPLEKNKGSKTDKGKSSNSKPGTFKSNNMKDKYENDSKTDAGKSFNSEQNDMKDTYWTDITVLSGPQESPPHKSHKRKGESQLQSPMKKKRPASESSNSLELSPKLESEQKLLVDDANHEYAAKNQGGNLDDNCEEDCSPTALILNFTEADSLPSGTDLSKIFNRFGCLKESETEVVRKTRRARVVFKRRADAEAAFSSAGKFSIFGPALVSYRLRYLPSTPKATHHATTRTERC
ncbi:uncharacterized protein LOC131253211 [Magnolia sinica]|uniref:uncharacterized protein LOC131253211 n=1 Tax=Magnolia sinica TaxID=86752 RepID=UPI002658D63B|nr:uncharacterized protein LOC131253211 [Magnolia sinica]XP_058110093.1 uncharacterized protein LOC131253211 [Magnolia sinica]XP_058110094.1 uncharacterized protein LOC131253211 [Magnolia sinica]XP_058110095.1 uncharacterized protein LOC131253211 [Magnolia sinica]